MPMIFADSASLPYPTILMGLFGGLALFLFGMELMANALKMVAGEGMRTVLGKLTTNRFTGAIAGATVTAIIQSSSVTTVLVVGFISAGLMNLTQAVGVIMGANIGTTVTAQIIAFKITHYALVLVALGFLLQFVFRSERVRSYGNAVLGLGLIFYGMQLMSDGMRPLQSYHPFIEFMKNMDSPLVGILFGALFTGLVQSSSATTGIVIVLASQGFLTLDAGIALIFGANIGTCVTAGLASLGKPCDAKRAVLVHILFNVAGVAVWFYFIPQLAELVTILSPKAEGLDAGARLAAETPRQIANAHAVFNISNTLLFIGFAGPLAWLVRHLVPDRADPVIEAATPKFIDEALLETPALALDMVRRELGRLGAAVLRITRNSFRTVVHGSRIELEDLRAADAEVDSLHAAIIEYLGKLSQANLDEAQSDQLHRYLSAANYFENIGDMVENSLVDVGRQRCDANLQISEATEGMLEEFHHEVCDGVDRAIRSLVDSDPAVAAEVTGAKPKIEALAERAEGHLSRRLVAGEPNRLIAFRLESEMIEYLKRMFYFAKRVAKLAAAEESRGKDEKAG
ncbi:MAG: Na/Pi cotransporter family protein [Verrucomicrobiales bacterium]